LSCFCGQKILILNSIHGTKMSWDCSIYTVIIYKFLEKIRSLMNWKNSGQHSLSSQLKAL
jgi:hypothetical protein